MDFANFFFLIEDLLGSRFWFITKIKRRSYWCKINLFFLRVRGAVRRVLMHCTEPCRRLVNSKTTVNFTRIYSGFRFLIKQFTNGRVRCLNKSQHHPPQNYSAASGVEIYSNWLFKMIYYVWRTKYTCNHGVNKNIILMVGKWKWAYSSYTVENNIEGDFCDRRSEHSITFHRTLPSVNNKPTTSLLHLRSDHWRARFGRMLSNSQNYTIGACWQLSWHASPQQDFDTSPFFLS